MRSLLAAALVCVLVPALRADDENPYKKAKIGDWAEYKMSTEVGGMAFTGKLKMTVTVKDDKEATVETTGKMSVMGQEIDIPPQKQKIDLTKPFDPTSSAKLPKGTEAKVTKDGDGTEKIKIGNKEYDCKWQKMKVAANANGKNLDTDIKVWQSKDVPLSGMVKMEMKSKLANMTMELTGSGSK